MSQPPACERLRSDEPAQPAQAEPRQAEPPQQRNRWQGWGRRLAGGPEKNHVTVKDAFKESAGKAAAATVRVFAEGEAVALGVVVDAAGYVLSKASVMDEPLLCRLGDGREFKAALVATDEDYDLALLKMEAEGLTPAPWQTGDPAPGTLVAAIDPDGQPMAIGVVSTEPRRIRGSTQIERERGWLGILLGGGDSGRGIVSVTPGSAAMRAGVRQGDVVKQIDGTAMESMQQIIDTVGGRRPGDAIKLLVQRDEEEVELSATLGAPTESPSPQDHWGGGPFSRRRAGFPRVIPHDVVVRPRDCGGPLVDVHGKVVGINIARALRVSTYAVPADTALQVVKDLRKARAEEKSAPPEKATPATATPAGK